MTMTSSSYNWIHGNSRNNKRDKYKGFSGKLPKLLLLCPDRNFRAPEHHPLRIGSNSQIQEGIGEIMNIQIAPDEERMSPDSILRDLADTNYLQDNMIQAQRAIEAASQPRFPNSAALIRVNSRQPENRPRHNRG
ncbi:hypothetical protein LINGRAHAP2_LOCUS11190 [Linum grandiflorum]